MGDQMASQPGWETVGLTTLPPTLPHTWLRCYTLVDGPHAFGPGAVHSPCKQFLVTSPAHTPSGRVRTCKSLRGIVLSGEDPGPSGCGR
eukprot:8959677-Heterocapsa_arctica.AAC.1